MNSISNSLPQLQTLDIERNGYNVAFGELGLEWHWDSKTFATLQSIAHGKGCVRHYLETQQAHLLRAYDADFLVDAIESRRSQFLGAMSN